MTATATSDERTAFVVNEIRSWAAEQFRIPLSDIDTDRPMALLGLDSLKAVALIRFVDEQYGMELEIEWLFDGISLAELAAKIATSSEPAPSAVPESRDPLRAAVHSAPAATAPLPVSIPADPSALQFSLFFFASDADQGHGDPYRLLLDSSRFADEHGFTGVWIPERHFHKFGGPFPNPSVLGAALAVATRRLRIRAGSVVLPLHDPIRVAEEWAVVDGLSGGRVDVAFATGWNADDFVFAPENYEDRQAVTFESVETVRQLWRGSPIERRNGKGDTVELRIAARPIQPELPVWITCSGGVERFRQAGAAGANVITALLFQDITELSGKIEAYRSARAESGFDPGTGHVTLMLHTFLGSDETTVRRTVEGPFKRYLADSVDLWRREAVALDQLDEQSRETVLAYAFERYYRTAALFGTPDSVQSQVDVLHEAGVNEIACLIDFGVDDDSVLASMRSLDALRGRYERNVAR
ncbi:MupA/Atu3671 family FMN-dependent luciferase-like monooxygenase [Nocardia sp. NPDC020380]|uniref:MupA/Atu3671 family FMN-dependent luciferase-like monooxygenase n=1 Tax=Nocardia sp. NPDC020380 TaxID=3364309 RepID=UPI0037919907